MMNQFEFMQRATQAIADIAFRDSLCIYEVKISREDISFSYFDCESRSNVTLKWFGLAGVEAYAKMKK